MLDYSHDMVTLGAQKHFAPPKELNIMIKMWPCLVNGVHIKSVTDPTLDDQIVRMNKICLYPTH